VFYIEGEKLVFEISANAFFRKMVRSITGTLLFYEKRKSSANFFKSVLEGGLRSEAGATLPPHGLFLADVGY